jgi:hypothetical protein
MPSDQHQSDTAPIDTEPGTPVSGDAAERAKLAGVLRASRVGCANPQWLNEAERRRCQDKLADGAKQAAYIQAPLPPERRAYYDQVARAKSHDVEPAPMQPWKTPEPSAGRGTSLAALVDKNEKVRFDLVACKFKLGRGGGVVHPAHTLKLGPLPCYVAPPRGPLTVEVGIRNPDTVVKGKAPPD